MSDTPKRFKKLAKKFNFPEDVIPCVVERAVDLLPFPTEKFPDDNDLRDDNGYTPYEREAVTHMMSFYGHRMLNEEYEIYSPGFHLNFEDWLHDMISFDEYDAVRKVDEALKDFVGWIRRNRLHNFPPEK